MTSSIVLQLTSVVESDDNLNNNNTIGFHPVVINGKKCRFNLNTINENIIWEQELTNTYNNTRTTIPLSQVISVRTCFCPKINTKKLICDCVVNDILIDDPIEHKVTFVKLYYAIPMGKHGWKVEFLTFQTDHTYTDSALFNYVKRIRDIIDGYKRPKRLLVFVNPFGGNRKGRKIYENKVFPIFKLASIEVDCVVTERANHAKDIILDPQIRISSYDGLISVGGDGMFAELLNGLLIRTQRDNGINWHSVDNSLKPAKTVLGVIPAGSTDAVAYGTTGINDPMTSSIAIVLGKRLNIDVCAVHHRGEEKLIRYSTSFLGYGFFGDTIADSESNRWMGPKRYDWAGIKKFIRHRLYSGEIKLCIEPSDGSPKDNIICTNNCEICAKAVLKKRDQLNEDDSPACISIRGKFLAINAATMTCRCKMTKNGISPKAHLGNGCTDLILVSQCSRLEYLKYLLRTAMSSKSPFDLNFVDVYRVREFEFNPIVGPNTISTNRAQLMNASVWNCDGEVVDEAAIHVKVHCQLISVFATGIDVQG
ncbi:ceramide kinase-like [Oppia nitens]|uniref:ceramide kinase-like n=1 Tax=Oppia nitens TaxID=1686743 RepID=UPI0023DBCF7F|nr:ceramide kinase-like [Oppia nitens]